MAANEVTIYNLALNSVGSRSNISLPSENSREAEVCRLWFPVVRDLVLCAAPWPVARGHSRLAQLAERDDTEIWSSSDPAPGFAYAYAAPADILYPQYLTSYGRFQWSPYGNQWAIMTDEESPVLAYTRKLTNIGLWDQPLFMAISFALAAYITMPLKAKPQYARENERRANELIDNARVLAANSEMNQVDSIAPWFAARGYMTGDATIRYVYPFGPFVSLQSIPDGR